MTATALNRLPKRVRRVLHAAGIATIPDLLAADRTALDLSNADRARLEYLVKQHTPAPPPAPVIIAEQPPAEPPAPLTAAAQIAAAGLPDLLTARQVSKYLQIAPRTIQKMCADGRITPAWKIGDNWRIPRGALVDLLKGDNQP
jgi:excisionase family DNA binding protein